MMAQMTDDPLSRALAALEQLAGTDMDPVAAAVWQTVRDAIQDARAERAGLLATAHLGPSPVQALSGDVAYLAALESFADNDDEEPRH